MAVVKFRAVGIFKPVVSWLYFIHGWLPFQFSKRGLAMPAHSGKWG
jgi:hypothetical protein